MNVRKLGPEYSKWFRDFAEDNGFTTNGLGSIRKLFVAIATGKYTIIDTEELEALKSQIKK